MMLVRIRQKFDESLDAWANPGMGGLWGTLATGLFAAAAVGGYTGLFGGNANQFLVNALCAGVAAAYAFCMTYVVGLSWTARWGCVSPRTRNMSGWTSASTASGHEVNASGTFPAGL